MTDVGAHAATSLHFKDNAKAALADANLQNALKFVEVNFIARRREVADKLPARTPDPSLAVALN